MDLFGSICHFDFNLLLKSGAKLNRRNQNGAAMESYKAVCEKAEARTC